MTQVMEKEELCLLAYTFLIRVVKICDLHYHIISILYTVYNWTGQEESAYVWEHKNIKGMRDFVKNLKLWTVGEKNIIFAERKLQGVVLCL